MKQPQLDHPQTKRALTAVKKSFGKKKEVSRTRLAVQKNTSWRELPSNAVGEPMNCFCVFLEVFFLNRNPDFFVLDFV